MGILDILLDKSLVGKIFAFIWTRLEGTDCEFQKIGKTEKICGTANVL